MYLSIAHGASVNSLGKALGQIGKSVYILCIYVEISTALNTIFLHDKRTFMQLQSAPVMS
jgi:hypothetical protein